MLSFLNWEAFAQLLDGSTLLFLTNLLVLLFVCRSSQPLPGQSATEEVHEDMAKRLQIIAARLFAPQVGINGHVPGSA